MALLLAWLLNALALLATAYLVPGFKIDSFQTALLVSLVLGVVNALLGPIVRTLTKPLSWLTFGLFSLVVNAAFLVVVSQVVVGFTIESFWPTALLGGLVLAVISTVLTALLRDFGKFH